MKINKSGIKKLKEIISENDYILVKASNAMKFDEITKALQPCDGEN